MEKIQRRAILTGLTGLAFMRPRYSWGARPSIIVASAEAAPPLSFRTAAGHMAGMVVDSVNAVTESLGWAVEVVGLPWARSQELVRQAEADAHVTLATPERQRYLRFAKAPLFVQNASIIHFSPRNPRAAEIRKIRSLEDLRSFTIAMTLGDSWPKGLMEGWTNIVMVKDDATSFMLVAAERADLVIQSRESAKFAERTGDGQAFESFDAPFLVGGMSEFRFGLRRAFPDADALMDAFDRSQQILTENGALNRALAKYA